jgi:hypothetical protein
MAFAGQNVLHVWQPMHPWPMKYILPGLAAFCSTVFCPVSLGSDVFVAAIEPEESRSNGDAITAELTIINVLLLKFDLISFILITPFYFYTNFILYILPAFIIFTTTSRHILTLIFKCNDYCPSVDGSSLPEPQNND